MVGAEEAVAAELHEQDGGRPGPCLRGLGSAQRAEADDDAVYFDGEGVDDAVEETVFD